MPEGQGSRLLPQPEGVITICACNKGKAEQFVVSMDNGQTKTVSSEQEARTLVRINGGSYTKK